MKKIVIIIFIIINMAFGENMSKKTENKLTEFQKEVIWNKKTEAPFSGFYYDKYDSGIYTCANCGTPLYYSSSKFKSGCGWPSFDESIENNVKEIPDKDGIRTEIVCAKCGGHLGHIFKGEGFTKKNIRHCVNSASMNFIPQKNIRYAYVAGGCFWGVEYYMEKLDGVIMAISGYSGGKTKNPTYHEVSYSNSGHLETVKIVYDSTKIDYETVIKYFFNIHDPTQANGQGPDIGKQYLSAIFYKNDNEKIICKNLINQLSKNGYNIATKLIKFNKFWKAEEYHQNYYSIKNSSPYCHTFIDRFKNKKK